MTQRIENTDSVKARIKTSNGNIECVLTGSLVDEKLVTFLCLSSQIGCKHNCKFCGLVDSPFIRNVTCAEYELQCNTLLDNKQTCSWASFMGMGEPLENTDNIHTFLNKKNSFFGITLSTIGISNTIEDIHSFNKYANTTFHISLVSWKDYERHELMPDSDISVYDLIKIGNSVGEMNNTLTRLNFPIIEGINDSEDFYIDFVSFCNENNLQINNCILKISSINSLKYSSDITAANKQNVHQLFLKLINHPILSSTFYFLEFHSKGSEINAGCGNLDWR